MNCEIISSILDLDIYKLYMQNAVLKLYPNTNVTYKFKNRGQHRFTNEFINKFDEYINSVLTKITLTELEYEYLEERYPYFGKEYLDYLAAYRFNPKQLSYRLTSQNDLDLTIKGKWHSTILWETVLMAIISELYFEVVNTNWKLDTTYELKTIQKANELYNCGLRFIEFGTRRRRSNKIQNIVCTTLKRYQPYYLGTSNLYFGMKTDCESIGTMAHEWIQAIAVLESMNHPNRFMMQKWNEVYKGQLGIALTDTFGLRSFLNDFDCHYARLYDGGRHDSGSACFFVDEIIKHYKSLNIDPETKTIVFSDALKVEDVRMISDYVAGRIKCVFGIGTNFTNDFGEESPALNMVIKLASVNDIPVVKLSDVHSKCSGDAEMVQIYRTIHGN